MDALLKKEPLESLLLRGGEVAELCGISRALAFRWMQIGILPTVRIPGCRTVRVPRRALLDFIQRQTKMTDIEQENERS